MELSFRWEESAGIPSPGQFFTLKASPFSDPLLRRPLAFSDASGDRASAIYQVRGPATRLLSALSVNSPLDIIAPLGRGFPLEDEPSAKLLVAGGIGLGPILFLARRLRISGSPGKMEFVAGFRDASSLPDIGFPAGSVICTDDGSLGFGGTTVDYLRKRNLPEGSSVFACGPHPMLAALAGLATERKWNAFFSVEQWMACGVGACMGCVVRRADGGYSRACSEGPVFRAEEIDWEAGR
jgi:dihydroorotate dehydrogenase electron transfer subunit